MKQKSGHDVVLIKSIPEEIKSIQLKPRNIWPWDRIRIGVWCGVYGRPVTRTHIAKVHEPVPDDAHRVTHQPSLWRQD